MGVPARTYGQRRAFSSTGYPTSGPGCRTPANRTQNAGLKPGVIPMGAKVTIRGNRNSDPKKFEMKTVRVTHDGKNYDVYPDRIS